jgi:hypothetical protein
VFSVYHRAIHLLKRAIAELLDEVRKALGKLNKQALGSFIYGICLTSSVRLRGGGIGVRY